MNVRKLTFLISACGYVAGVAIARSVPIFLGLFVSRNFGVDSYSELVYLLLVGSLAASVCSQGIIPQLLATAANDVPRMDAIWLLFLTLLISTSAATVLYFYSLSGRLINYQGVFCGAYCIGYSLVSIRAALLNRSRENLNSGLIWALTSVASAMFFILASRLSEVSFGNAMMVMGAAWISCGFLLVFCFQLPFRFSCHLSEYVGVARNAGSLTVFGTLTLAGLWYAAKATQFDTEIHRSSFSLGLQISSIIMFVPNMLGGIVIPVLSRRGTKDKFGRWIFLLYFLSSILLVLICLALVKYIYVAYQMQPLPSSLSVFYTMIAASVPAASSAFFIQCFGARNAYGTLAIISSCGFLILIVSIGVIDSGALGCAQSLLIANFVTFCLYFLVNYRTVRQQCA